MSPFICFITVEFILNLFNPFKPNGISQSYQSYQPIPLVRFFFFFFFFFFFGGGGGCIQILNRKFCNQTVETLVRRRVQRLQCLHMFYKKDAMLIWVKLINYVRNRFVLAVIFRLIYHWLEVSR